MNRYRLITVLTILATLFSIVNQQCVFAADSPCESAKQTYALLCTAGIMNKSDDFDFSSEISAEVFSDLYEAYFNEKPEFTEEKITNSVAVQNLAKHCPDETTEQKDSITGFKDYGLIDKSARNAYKKMCANGYLEFYEDFLNFSDSLTYNDYLSMLSYFKTDFAKTRDMTLTSGKVINSSSHNNIITLSVDSGSKVIDFKFKRNEQFMVYKDSVCAPYSYNISRDDTADFYTKSDKIIYVCIGNENDLSLQSANLRETTSVYRSKIYLCNTQDSTIIFKNSPTGAYSVFKYDSNTLIYNGNTKKSISDINNLFLDLNCGFIVDNKTNTVRYINIE